MSTDDDAGGRLYVVGTPIGNLGDMSPRATHALRAATLIACEDTRRTGKLLELLGLPRTTLLRMDEHTETEAAKRVVDEVEAGAVVAVVSDAGMPGLSDPGNTVVSLAKERGLPTEVIPGPFAGAVAAVASGLLGAGGRFAFEGFLPRKGTARTARLAEVAANLVPTILYESPHRVSATIADLEAVCGSERTVALCRELTKMHEQIWQGSLGEAAVELTRSPPRGEYALVVAAAEKPEPVSDHVLRTELDAEVAHGASQRDAAETVSVRHGVSRNRVKKLADY